MTHCTSTIVAFRFVCSAGNATFTTVSSMNAMLEARVVAASTQGPEDFEQGAVAASDRIMLSSQGSRMNADMMVAYHCRAIFSFARLEFNIPQRRHQSNSTANARRAAPTQSRDARS